MARSHAKISTSIWDDPEFISINSGAQRLYKLLLSQKKLTLIGLLAYTPSRWARLAPDTTLDSIEDNIHELEASRNVIVDRDTDELLIRTLVKNDVANTRMLDNTNLLRGMWNAWTAIESRQLRHVAVENIPASVWDSPKATPPAEATELRTQPVQMPSSQQLECHIRTSHSNQPLERDVGTSLLPSPFALPDVASVEAAEADLKSAAQGKAAAVDNSVVRLSDQERQHVLADAVELLVARELLRNPTHSGNPQRHADAVANGKLKDHHHAGHLLLTGRPDLTPDELADLLEPPPQGPDTNGAGERLDHRYDDQQQAMLQRAEEGLAQVKEIAEEEPDIDLNLKRLSDIREALYPSAPKDPEQGESSA